MNERMDISPLPHKQPHFVQVDVPSPSPKSATDEGSIMQSSPPRPSPLEAPRPIHGVE
jgi:M-phase inducer tyrosine phosphatase